SDSNTPLSSSTPSRFPQIPKTQIRSYVFFFPCLSLTGVGRRIVARNGLLPPPSHLASAPAVPTPQPVLTLTRVYAGPSRCRRLAALGPTRICFFLFLLCFFLTHFDWADPHSRTFAVTLNTTTPSPAAPRLRPRHIDMAATPLDPTDTATTTTTPPRRRHLDTASPLPQLDPAAPAPSRHDPYLDAGAAIATHPVYPDPTSTGAISTRPHRHLDVCTITTTRTPPRPHPTGAVSTRPPPPPRRRSPPPTPLTPTPRRRCPRHHRDAVAINPTTPPRHGRHRHLDAITSALTPAL
ncbi:hypothetical protein EDB85DRAFT_989424, partial [Lactarius pseudohatsudake]